MTPELALVGIGVFTCIALILLAEWVVDKDAARRGR